MNIADLRHSNTPSSRFSLAEGDLPYPSNTNIGAAEEISLAGQKPILARAKRKLKVEGTTQTGKEVGVGKELNARKEARVKKELGAKPLSKIKHGLDAD